MPQHETPIEVRHYRRQPFVMVPLWILDLLPGKGLSHTALAVYVALGRFADNWTGEAFPGIATVAAAVGRGNTVTRAAVAELEQVGAVKVIERPRPGARNLPNLYLLAGDEPIPEADRHRDTMAPDGAGPVDSPAADVPAWAVADPEPVDNPPSQGRNGGEGSEFRTQVPPESRTQVPPEFRGGTRTTLELDSLKEKEMSGGDAAPTSRAEAGPVENPSPAPAAPSVAEDFGQWWDAFRAMTNAPTGPKKTAAAAYATARRNGASAAVMLDGLAAFAAGRARDERSAGWAANWPHAVTWIRQARWEEYPSTGPQGAQDGPGAARASSDAFRRAEAVRGPYSPPELAADLTPDDYRLAMAADRADFLAGSGRWEGVTAQ